MELNELLEINEAEELLGAGLESTDPWKGQCAEYGTLAINDVRGRAHVFAYVTPDMPNTNIEWSEDEGIVMEGCGCYVLYSQPNRGGSQAHITVPGKHTGVPFPIIKSVYKESCAYPIATSCHKDHELRFCKTDADCVGEAECNKCEVAGSAFPLYVQHSLVCKPGGGGGGGTCFASSSDVETREGVIKIPQLRIGDEVRTSYGGLDTAFTKFLGWTDRHKSRPAKMLQIFTANKATPLTLSASHVVFTVSGTTKYAGDLVPGESLLYWTGEKMEEREITEIKTSIESGFWMPLTSSGTLLVNGFLMSCYGSFPHNLADMAMVPVKALPEFLLDNEESQHEDGLRPVVKVLKQLGRWIGVRRNENQGTPDLLYSTDRLIDHSFIGKSEL